MQGERLIQIIALFCVCRRMSRSTAEQDKLMQSLGLPLNLGGTFDPLPTPEQVMVASIRMLVRHAYFEGNEEVRGKSLEQLPSGAHT
jgi:hypothetical protein